MCDSKKRDIFSRIISIIAVILALFAFLLSYWQTNVTLRPKISFNEDGFSVYEKKILPSGNLKFGLQFNFINKGGSEISGLNIYISCLVDSQEVGKITSNLINKIYAGDTFNRAITIIIPNEYFSHISQNAIIFNKNIFFKLSMDYPRAWFGRYKQKSYVFWNKETNRLEHCDLEDVKRIDNILNFSKI